MSITVKIWDYNTDYDQGYTNISFDSLESFMNYVIENADRLRSIRAKHGEYNFITYHTTDRRFSKEVRTIKNENGILFSDGYDTGDIKYCSKSVAKMIDELMDRVNHPVYKFVEE